MTAAEVRENGSLLVVCNDRDGDPIYVECYDVFGSMWLVYVVDDHETVFRAVDDGAPVVRGVR